MKLPKNLFASYSFEKVDKIPDNELYAGIQNRLEDIRLGIVYLNHIFNKFNEGGKINYESAEALYSSFRNYKKIKFNMKYILSFHPTLSVVYDGKYIRFLIRKPNVKRTSLCFSCGYWNKIEFTKCPKCSRYMGKEITGEMD